MAKTKSGFPWITAGAVVVIVALAGTAIGIDWEDLVDQLTRERSRGKEVCFVVSNDPRQAMYISWHVGATADRFPHPKAGRYKHCEPAETGEQVGLNVERSTPGKTTCLIVQIPDNITIGPEVTVEGTTDCATAGVVV